MLTPSEVESGWLKSQDERLLAKTAPDLPVDGTLPAGLSYAPVEDDHQHHLQLQNNNDRA
jgi:hypothetical protein